MYNLKSQHSGFTLIELVVVTAVVSVLASVAYPTYTNYVNRSNRLVAINTLLRIQLIQEDIKAETGAYGSLEAVKEKMPGKALYADGKTYKISFPVTSVSSYEMTADLNANSGYCTQLKIDNHNVRSATVRGENPDNSEECWSP